MPRGLSIALALIVAVHGLVHLMGAAAYLKLAEVEALPYRTTLLAGRWDVGDEGIRAVGALYGLAALAFLVATAAWQLRWAEWRTLLLGAAVLSLIVTGLDWEKAHVGVVVNVAILATLAVTSLNYEL